MDLVILGGKYRGKKINVPSNIEDFRPTKSMVKEAVCSSIMMDIPNANVLELCGGSGAFSFELISRGAQKTTVIELNKKRATFITNTAKAMGIENQVDVIHDDAISYVENNKSSYDIIFFDPPYHENTLTDLLVPLFEMVHVGGVLIFEQAKNDTYPQTIIPPNNYKCKSKKYGQTLITYFRREE